MMKLTSDASNETFPAAFLKVPDHLPRGLDRRLGYCGHARFVFFYYEPLGEEVVWNDGRSYGFGTGAWGTFMQQVARLADRCRVNVGSERAANTHVLLIDREGQAAYFVPEWEAERFLTQRARSAAA